VPTEETKAFCYGRILQLALSARLTQAASIPEDLTDNELDEVLNAKTSFNKRVITDLQNTADKMGYKRSRLIMAIVSAADLLQDRLSEYTYKPGHGSRTITSDGGTSLGCTALCCSLFH
jgi:NADH pyrophosphatase NudC (nudix superfamily)